MRRGSGGPTPVGGRTHQRWSDQERPPLHHGSGPTLVSGCTHERRSEAAGREALRVVAQIGREMGNRSGGSCRADQREAAGRGKCSEFFFFSESEGEWETDREGVARADRRVHAGGYV